MKLLLFGQMTWLPPGDEEIPKGLEFKTDRGAKGG